MSKTLYETINTLTSDCVSCDSKDCFEDCPLSDCLYPSTFKDAKLESDCNITYDDLNYLSKYCREHFKVNKFFQLTCDCMLRNEQDKKIWCEGKSTPPYLWELNEELEEKWNNT